MSTHSTSEAVTRILQHSATGATLREHFFQTEAQRIAHMALRMAVAIAKEKKILLCGNGGSAADCQHLAAEFVNRFQIDRPPLPAIALTTDTSAITAIGNDFSFDEIFSKQVKALGQSGDILLGISTSGNSKNVVKAFEVARENNVYCLGFAGKNGGAMVDLCHTCFIVREANTALVQEVHIALAHLLCALTDYYLFENTAELSPYLQGNAEFPI